MKRIIPTALITLGIVLSFCGFSLLLKRPASLLATVDLPTQLAGSNITESQQGMNAIAVITDLHGQEFPVDFGAARIYEDRDVIVWVAGAVSESIAVEMTNAIQQKIAEGNSPFTPIDEIDSRNRKVYVLEGMRQKHYYFQSQNLAIWLAVNPAFADKALQQILEVYS